MSLKLNVPKTQANLTPRITVIGVGGAGGNAVNNMIQANLEGVDFLIANTDAQAIQLSLCERCIQLGRNITQGLGAGSRPDIGRAATEEALDEILGQLEGTNMVFITAGMGGGTGTGGAPVIARAAREAGILTVGVVTKPFHFEGVHRMQMAEAGIVELTQYVDTLIVIPNQNLFRIANEKTTFADAFKMADDVLYSGVRGVTDLMVMPGLINLDFADIRSVMTEMGKAMMGTGIGEGDSRALAAAEAAISNPLLDDVSMRGARGVLINVTGGPDMTLFEVDETANRIRDEVDPDANIIFGSTFDDGLEGKMRVSVVATGIDSDAAAAPKPVSLSLVQSRVERAAPAPSRAQAPVAQAPVAQAPVAQAAAQMALREEVEPAEAPAAEPDEAEAIAEAAEDEIVLAAAQAEAEPESEPEPERAEAAPVARSEPAEAPPALPEAARRPGGSSLFAYSKATAQAEAAPAPKVALAAARAEEPVATRPSEADGGEAFIAPEPAQPESLPETAARARPDPFAAAALANGSRTAGSDQGGPGAFDRKRAQSLFAKVTGGAARALQAAAQASDPRSSGAAEASAAQTPRPAARAAVQPAPARVAAAPARAAAAPAPAASPRPAAQPRLSGLEPAERSGPAPSEEELLEIPAFLRRQAN